MTFVLLSSAASVRTSRLLLFFERSMLSNMKSTFLLWIFLSGAALCSATEEDISDMAAGSSEEDNSPWQDYTNSVVARTKYLLANRKHCDVTLTVGNGSNIEDIKAHSLVLGMTSPVFESKFFDAPRIYDVNLTFEILDISPRIFKKLLRYMYTDEIPKTNMSDTWDLWYAAAKFEIKELTEKTSEQISMSLDINTVWDALVKAQQYDETKLEEKCFQYILTQASEAVRHPQFYQLSKKNIMKIVRSPILKCTEIELFKGIILWGKTQLWKTNQTETAAAIKQNVADLIPLVHFENMAAEDFVSTVIPSNVVNKETENQYLLKYLKPILSHSDTRNSERAKSSEMTCSRNNPQIPRITELLKLADYIENSINFRAVCQSECYFSGFQVTEGSEHCSSPRSLTEVSVVIRSSSQRILFSSALATLDAPYRINFTEPLLIKSGRTYNIYFKLKAAYRGICRRQYQYDQNLSQSTAVYSNFPNEVKCKNIDFTFSNDETKISYSTVDKGFMPTLYFITADDNI